MSISGATKEEGPEIFENYMKMFDTQKIMSYLRVIK